MDNMTNFVKYRFFSIEKTVQIFYYIQKLSRVFSKLDLIKLLFFADRIHIRRHYSFISLDTYIAMKNGPVASGALDVLNKNKERLDNFSQDELKYLDHIKMYNHKKRTLKPIQFDLLSNNEKSSLDKSIALFSGKDLVDISHDYPEWKRYKDLFEKRIISSRQIKIQDFFSNPDVNDSPALQKYFNGVDPLYESKEYLEEALRFYIESMGQNAT